jgi:heterodisulfide reductase subunit B2
MSLRYSYFPGCSAEATGKAYDISARAVCKKLGIDLVEIPDWNCCGATAYFSIRELESFGVSARNLALAQEMGSDDVVATCNACYTILAKTNRYLAEDENLHADINEALNAAGRSYDGSLNVRHLLDVMVNDLGCEAVSEKVTRRLSGLKVAPYYGCQASRPMGTFDDPEFPVTLDHLIEATGAEAVYYPVKTKCCGGMLMMTEEEAALRLNLELMQCARDNGADVIVTMCPLCEMNVEAYQPMVNKRFGTDFKIPVMYFTQLLGVALGISSKGLALDKQIVPVERVLAQVPA